jgi:hypothetical protein
MVTIFVPDLPELVGLIDAARRTPDCEVVAAKYGYWTITARDELRFVRKDLGMGPALWSSALSGGFCGRIVEYSADVLRIASEGEPT